MLVGEMLVRLGIKNEMSKGLSQATQDIQGFGRQSQSAFSRFTGGIGGAFGAAGMFAFQLNNITQAVSGTANSIMGLGRSLIGGNIQFENFNARFTTMLGSAEAAKQRMAELANFGATTPFELPGVVQADILLQTFGLHAEDAAAKWGKSGSQIRTIAGDTAAAVGAGMDEIAMWLGRFASGSTGEAMMRMTELGAITRQELTAMGVEFDKSGALITDNATATSILFEALTKKFGGQMDVMSGTMSGKLSNLADRWDELKRTMGAATMSALSDSLSRVLELMGSPRVTQFAEAVGRGLGKAVQLTIDSFITLGQAIRGDWTDDGAIHPLHRAIGFIGTIIHNQVIPAFMFVVGVIQNQVIPGFMWLFDVARSGWGLINRGISAALPFIISIKDAVLGFGSTLIDTLWPIAQQVFGFFRENVVPILASLSGFLGVAGGAFALISAKGAIFSAVAAALPPIIAGIASALGFLLGPIGLIAIAIGVLAAAYTQNWFGIRDITNNVVSTVAGFITGTLIPTFISFWGSVQPILERFGGFLRDTVIPAVIEFGSTVASYVTGTIIPAIIGFAETALPYLLQFGSFLIDTLIPSVIQFGTTIYEYFTGTIIPTVMGFWAAIQPTLMQFGTFLLETAIPAIIQFGTTVGTYFTGTILPAILGFWEQAQPVLAQIGTFFTETLIPTILGLKDSIVPTFQNDIMPVIMELGETASHIFNNILVPAFNIFTSTVMPALLQAWDDISAEVIPTIQSLGNIAQTVFPILAVVIGAIPVILYKVIDAVVRFLAANETVREIIGTVWQFVSNTVKNAITIVSNLLQLVMNLIQGDWSEAWLNLQTIVDTVWAQVQNVIGSAVSIVISLLSGLASAALEQAQNLVSWYVGALAAIVTEGPGKIAELYTAINTKLGELALLAVTKGAEFVLNMVTELANLVTQAPGKIAEMASGVGTQLEMWITTGVAKAVSFVTGIVDEVAKLITQAPAKIGEMIVSVAGTLAGWVSSAIGFGTDFVEGIKQGILNGAMGIKDFINQNLIQPMKDAVTDPLGIFSPSKWMIEQARHIIDGLSVGFDSYSPEAIDRVKGIVETIKSVFDGLSSAMNISGQLNAFSMTGGSFANVSKIVDDALAFMRDISGSLIELAARYETDFVDKANKIADLASKGIGLIGSAFESFLKLQDVALNYDAIRNAITTIKLLIEHVTESLAYSMFHLEGKAGEGGGFVNAADVMAQSAMSGIDLISKAVDSFSKLSDFSVRFENVKNAVSQIKFIVEHILESFGWVAIAFSENHPQGFLASAMMLAENAIPAVDLVGKAIEAFSKLTEFTLTFEQVKEAVSQIKFIIEHVVESLGWAAQEMLQHRPEGFVEGSQAFANAAVSGIELITNAVESLVKLTEFTVTFDSIRGAVTEIKFAVEHIVDEFGLLGRRMELLRGPEMLNSANTFAINAATIMDLLGRAVEAFKSLAENGFVAPATETIDKIVATVYYITDKLRSTIQDKFTPEGLTAASDFANTAGSILSLIGDGMSKLSGITEFEAPSLEAIDRFTDTVVWVVKNLRDKIANKFEKEGLTQASDFSDAAKSILDMIGSGIASILKIGEPKELKIMEDRINDFLQTTFRVVRQIHTAAIKYDTDGLTATRMYAEAASAIMDLIGKSSSFDALSEYGKGMIDNFGRFLADVKTAVQMLIDLGRELDKGLDEAVAIAKKVAEIIGLLQPSQQASGSGKGSGSGAGAGAGSSGSGSATGVLGKGGSGGGGGKLSGNGVGFMRDAFNSRVDWMKSLAYNSPDGIATFHSGTGGEKTLELFNLARKALGATLVIDGDGLRRPKRGFDLWDTGAGWNVNPFFNGGMPLSSGYGFLEPRDVVLSPSAPAIAPIVKEMVNQLGAQLGNIQNVGGGMRTINIAFDGKVISSAVIEDLSSDITINLDSAVFNG